MACGLRRVYRCPSVLVLMLMAVRMGRRQPRLCSWLKHVAWHPRKLLAVRWQVRVREALYLRGVGKDVRRWGLLRERVGRVRIHRVHERCAAAAATEAARPRREGHSLWLLLWLRWRRAAASTCAGL
jgi:hypothetical protein